VRGAAWRANNPERNSDIKKAWYLANTERVLAEKKIYYAAHKQEISSYVAKRRRSDPDYRLRLNLRARLRRALGSSYKSGSAVRDLGCTVPELKKHLESKFQPGMTWDNYGGWHIDHIKPLASFDLTDRAQFLQACHYTNLQPLWAEENLRKSDYYVN
jgi:hypothetical protein